ncbi:unnamed protein product [Nezara viridula]|uniref:Suppressor of white apricot N-terminal domain-containing protein n=1 Tax=Nezara viridula TaxID=85310 RepID=A0A9P0H0F9_NEZVI|nr:unnamed protein product [Nezara viridula]
MWHEIRKQERKIRCMIVDYKRRAERRRDYYEKIKADPTQFLQIHGRSCKIHLDPQVAAAGDSPAVMMSWQGAQDVMIDRFDVRAHLDYIQEYRGSSEEKLSYDERLINYERYRILVQNDFLGVSEEKFLHQIYLEEQFGAIKSEPQPIEGKKKIAGAAIGYNYDEPAVEVPLQQVPPPPPEPDPDTAADDEEEDDSDIDFDMCVDVNKVSTQQAHELNNCGHIYGMDGNDFFSFLTKDKEEADNLRIAKELEEEKAMYSGRKSRRERRAYRDKKLAGRKISPPSYASRKSPTYRDYCDLSRSRSKSASPVNSGKITYITSFSGEEPVAATSPKIIQHKPYKSSSDDHRSVKYRSRTPDNRRHRYRSKSRSKSREKSHRRRSRSRSRSQSNSSRSRYRSSRRSRSVSRSYSKSSSQRDQKSTRSKSKSPLRVSNKVDSKSQPVFNPAVPVKQPPAPIISRYYGRRGHSSSSELSISEDDDEKNTVSSDKQPTVQKKPWTDFGNSSGRNKVSKNQHLISHYIFLLILFCDFNIKCIEPHTTNKR